jgi:phosphoenolpyruvate carboxylase
MMGRFCAYVDKMFGLGMWLGTLRDGRSRPVIPGAAIFASAFTMFATGRDSLHGLEPDLRMPTRLRGIVGSRLPSCDTIGRVYALLDSEPLRRMLRDVAFRLKRNKAIANGGGWYFAAVDGHEFFRQPETLLSRVPDPHPHDSG